MTRRSLSLCLLVVCILGLALRLVAWQIEPPLHPDEYYQYLEPAWLRMHGIGVEPWEWRAGIRSWVLPSYNGAWLALITKLGYRSSTAVRVIQLHWALISMVMVWAGYRGGADLCRRVLARESGGSAEALIGNDGLRPGWQGGLLGATMCSLFPLLVMQAPHTLSEAPSMFALVFSLVLAQEATEPGCPQAHRAAAGAGICAALGVCLRIANGPLAFISLLVLIVSRRYRLAAVFCIAGCIPVAVFGLVDRVTWGGFLSSYIGYIRFNFLEGRAAEFGVLPAEWYWRKVIERLPTFVALFSLILYRGRRIVWPYLLATVGLLVYLTTQAHKEERFIVALWPFLLIGVSGLVGAELALLKLKPLPSGPWLRRVAEALRQDRYQVVCLSVVAFATATDSLLHSARDEIDVTISLESKTHASRGLMAAQAWVGSREDLSGVLIQEMGMGYAGFGATAPMLVFDRAVRQALVFNPVLNYAIVEVGSSNIDFVRTAGYKRIKSFGNYDVFWRGCQSADCVSELNLRRRTKGRVKPQLEQARKLELVAKRTKHSL